MYEKIGSPQSGTCVKVIKVFNIIAACLLIGFGAVGMIYMILHNLISAYFFLIFSPIFIIIFGLVMIGFQFRIGIIVNNFQFLGSLLGRGIFYIYLSSSVFFYFTCGTDDTVAAWICSMIIFGLGVLYVVLHFCNSGYGSDMKQQMTEQ